MTTAARTYTEEASHWYKPSGEPCYEVERADGKGMRPTTLRDAKKLGLYPSVTTILKCIAKPELQSWLIEQAVLSVLTTPRIVGEADDAFVHRVMNTERVQDQEAQKARERGTEIHAAMESLSRGQLIHKDIYDWVWPAFSECIKSGEVVCTEKAMTCADGYGGMIDLVQKNDKWIITDFKTTKKLPEKDAWSDAKLQLAAYAHMWHSFLVQTDDEPLSIETRNVYISTVEKGRFVIHQTNDWVRRYNHGFWPILRAWQYLNDHQPLPNCAGEKS